MKHNIIFLTSAILFVLALGCVSQGDVHAGGFVNGGGCTVNISNGASSSDVAAYDNGFFDCVIVHPENTKDQNGTTVFDLDFRASGKCKTTTCEQVGNFTCATPGIGAWYLKIPKNKGVKVTRDSSKDTGDWEYYKVLIPPATYTYPGYNGETVQSVAGYIRVKKPASTPKYTLKVNAVEGKYNGNGSFVSANNTIETDAISPVTVEKGKSATLNIGSYTPPAGYTWVQWGGGGVCASAGTSKTCTVSNVTTGHTINAYFVRNRFEGNLTVSGGEETASTGYTGETDSWSSPNYAYKNILIEDCGNGCDVSFAFNLKTVAGSGTTNYNLFRWEGEWKQMTSLPSWKSGDAIPTKTEHIEPGEKICWQMSYYAIARVTTPSTNGPAVGRVRACAEVVDVGFKGKVDVSGSVSGSTGFVSSDTSSTDIIPNCPSTGCSVTFSHSIKRSGGSYTTPYEIVRESNLQSKVANYSKSGNSAGADNIYSDTLTMYPGMRLCETLKFAPDARKPSKMVELKRCVLAAGTADSSIDIKAKNENVDAYSSWQDSEIYAKPTDRIALKSAYTPRYQYAYELMVDSVKVSGNVVAEQNQLGENLETIFNKDVNPGWNNAFSVDIFDNGEKNNLLNGTREYKRDIGVDTPDQKTLSGDEAYRVSVDDVGKVALTAKAETNGTTGTTTTPNNIIFSYTNSRYGYLTDAVVNIDSISDSVSIRVPYNFNNTTAITSNVGSTNVPAGGQVDIKFNYSINPKPNTQTTNGSGEEYATSVDNAKWKLKYCFGAECDNGVYSYETPESEGTSYDVVLSEMSTGKTIDNLSQTVDIPDIEAGTKFCVKSSVYPANSGADNNYNNPNGSGTWVDSAEATCFKVGKQPSFQVWGGDIYSEKNISLPQTTKTINGEKRVFGSWTELGLVAKGEVTGLASGAGMGYDGLNLAANPGGSSKSDFCSMSTLSFNNTTCNSFVGKATQASALDLGMDLSDDEKMQNDGWTVFNNVDWPIPGGHYYSSTGIYEGWYGYGFLDEEKADKILWKKDGDVSIPINIRRRGRDGGSNSWDDISKLVIYAKNIKISCDVTHIDAVLIAEDNIDTCANLARDNLDNRERSTPLRINGVIIAGTLTLGRTYGAGKGADSIVPAEVINYDASLYSWASGQPGSASGGGLTEAYSSELAPRY